MPPKRKKNKTTRGDNKQTNLFAEVLPEEVQHSIYEILNTLPTLVETNPDEELPSDKSTPSIWAKKLKKALTRELGLRISESEILETTESVLRNNFEPLKSLIASTHLRNEKADTCFSLLDYSKKGVIVIQDLQKVAGEFLGSDVSDDELQEMIDEFDRSGDGVLTLDDFYRIARKVNL